MGETAESVSLAKTTAEIAKLQAEARKLAAEAAEAGRPTWARPTVWIPLLIALGTGFGGLLSAWFTWQIKSNEVERANINTEKQTLQLQKTVRELEDQKKTLDTTRQDLEVKAQQAADANKTLELRRSVLESEVQEAERRRSEALAKLADVQGSLEKVGAIAAAATKNTDQAGVVEREVAGARDALGSASDLLDRGKTTIFLQFRGALERDVLRGLQASLNQAGYRVPGIERVAGEYGNEVRYFHAEDRARAKDVAALVAAYFKDACRLRSAPAVGEPMRLAAPAGQLEVWIGATTGACQ